MPAARGEPVDDQLASLLPADIPSAAAVAIQRGRPLLWAAVGVDPAGAPLTVDHPFDVASITKVMVTTMVSAVLASRGELDLERPVAAYLPAFAAAGKGDVRVREVLAHSSGLPAWQPMFSPVARDPLGRQVYLERPPAEAFARGRDLVLDAVCAAGLGRRGHRVYSDLGFIALGALLERVSGLPLPALAQELVFAPLGLRTARFVDLSRSLEGPYAARFAGGVPPATGTRRPREPAPGQEGRYPPVSFAVAPRPGEVDDDHAFVMGGAAGHAGLFASPADLGRFLWLLYEEIEGADRLNASALLARFARPDRSAQPSGNGALRGLGFDLITRGASSGAAPYRPAFAQLGRAGPRGAIGHLGFTGCSFWLDLDRALAVALCTNRTLPGRHHVDAIRQLRYRFHERVLAGTTR